MPYETRQELPDSVKEHLPEHAQEIFREAFNSAWEQYADREDREGDDSREATASQVAWAAVKNEYEKDPDTGRWEKRSGA
jgi:cation transport regulator